MGEMVTLNLHLNLTIYSKPTEKMSIFMLVTEYDKNNFDRSAEKNYTVLHNIYIAKSHLPSRTRSNASFFSTT